ncbi:hypothetical protein PIB30_026875 [Stylosanthes scabra]|uniref:Uncharacterized protein n=1 Tax=Stylosanthes scabra TaxID=79078 RepID=A0ABU6UAQ7_9FABA|nr:hypothetical protein [Stylosanthes scabra]
MRWTEKGLVQIEMNLRAIELRVRPVTTVAVMQHAANKMLRRGAHSRWDRGPLGLRGGWEAPRHPLPAASTSSATSAGSARPSPTCVALRHAPNLLRRWRGRRILSQHVVQPLPVPSGGPHPNHHRCTLWHHVLEVPKATTHMLAVDGETQLVRDILECDSALAPRHVERMSLWSPPLYEGADERLVNLEPAFGQSCNREQTGRCTNGSTSGSGSIAICRRTLVIHLSRYVE